MLLFAYYLLKIIICSAVLFGYYWFFLRNKVFHAYNRFYLLAIVILSIGLPLVKLNIFHEATNQPTVVKMLQVVTASDEYMDEIFIAPTKSSLSFVDFLPFIYGVISAAFLFMLVQMLVSIFILLKSNGKIYLENIHFINTDAARGTPFSFFKYIFWNNQIDINSPSGNRIFKHEVAHVQERHSWDKMFINLVLIVFWSNPIFWLIRKELSMIHEFIADKKAVEDGDTAAFAAMILHATYPQKNFYITNNFFYSPIKRRLMMLTKNQHPRMNYISRLLVLPLLIIVFGAFTIKIANNISQENNIQKLDRKIVVVLDAGHGGQDAGGINKNGIKEKDLALQLVKKIKALNKDENIEIILTRDKDIYSDPFIKADFAKEINPDLFLSIHLDNTPKAKWNTVSGMNVFVAEEGRDNVKKSKVLGTVIINSFKGNFGLGVPTGISQRQKGIFILQANSFPSVLIEAGYITNDKDADYLLSEKGQETFAKNVLDAIRNFAQLNLVKEPMQEKAKLDSPPAIKIEVTQVEDSKRNQELLKNPRVTDLTIDLDNKKNLLGTDGLIVLNNKIYNKKDLQNKVIKGSTCLFYRKGDAAMIKKYGAAAANGVAIVENATIEDMSPKENINGSKNVVKFSTDEIFFMDENGKKINTNSSAKIISSNKSNDAKNWLAQISIENCLYVVNGKVSEKKELESIAAENIVNINVLKGNSAVALYGEKGKYGVIEITTKPAIISKVFNDKIFTQVEIEPEFPGGNGAWGKFLQENLDGSIATKANLKDGSYVFTTKFIVHEDGSLSDFTSEPNINTKIAMHCIEVLKKSPKWKPAIQNGHTVSAYRKQPITFVISEEMDDKKKVISQIDPSMLKHFNKGAQSLEY